MPMLVHGRGRGVVLAVRTRWRGCTRVDSNLIFWLHLPLLSWFGLDIVTDIDVALRQQPGIWHVTLLLYDVNDPCIVLHF